MAVLLFRIPVNTNCLVVDYNWSRQVVEFERFEGRITSCGQKTHLFKDINALAVNTPAARPF
jgi:hypothetical protein